MRTISLIAVITIVVLNPAAPLGAQCGDRIGNWGHGPSEAADGNGSVAVFGSGRVLQLATVSDPSNPVLESSVDMPGTVEGLAVAGTWAYVAAAEGGFVVVDISSPRHPEMEATVEIEGRVRNVSVVGDLAYIVSAIEGLIIVDVSDPTAPVRLSALDPDGNFNDVAVHGNRAYVADNRTGLRVVDVADPENPVLLATIDDLDHSRRVAVSDDGLTVYLTNYFDGFHVIDVSDSLAPELVRFVGVPSYTIDLEIDGGYLYAANRGNGMRVFDLADPLEPVDVWQVNEDGSNQSVAIHGSLAYLANYEGGLRLVDVTDPPEAEEIGFIVGTPESKGVSVQGGVAYVAGGNQQVILDLARPDLPVALSMTPFVGYVNRAVVDGRYVYATGNYSGLRVIDIDDPERPVEVGFVEMADAYDVVKDGDLVYISCYDEGITVADVSVPTDPVVVGTIEGFRVGFINHSRGVVYAPDYNVGVRMVDVTDPTAPVELGLLDVEDPIGRPEVNGNLLFIADSSDGVVIFDNTDPRAPVRTATITGARYGFGMAAMRDLLFVATIFDGAYVFDVADPAAPMELASMPLATLAEGEVSSEGNLALVAEISGGVEVFDLGGCFTEAPVADFVWRPVNPEAGRSVRLTDTSVGAVDARHWNFGDGGGSSQRNPSHVWAEPGDYDVTLTASGVSGSQAVTRTVTVEPRSGGVPSITDPGAFSYVIAAAAHARGLANTRWVTDAVLHNAGATEAHAHIWFMKEGQDNTGAAGEAVEVDAGASILIEDIVFSLFEEEAASGAVLVGSDQPLLVTSRTYNDSTSGTYGQFIPGRDTTSGVDQKESVHLVQLTRSADFRTNLGIANPTDQTIEVDVSLHDGQGMEINALTLTVPRFGFVQRSDVLGANADDAYAVVSSSTVGASFFPYASVVDNRTGDPMMVEPIEPAVRVVVAAAAHVAGFEGADWRTDLEVCNFRSAPVELRLELLRSDQNNSSPSSVDLNVDGTSCDRMTDVLSTLFTFEGSAALGVRSSSGAAVVSSRTFNSTEDGTYGQCLPGYPDIEAIGFGKQARMIQLAQNSGFRTNIGFVNRASTLTTVRVDLRDSAGSSLGILTFGLEPFEHRQINRVFLQVTSAPVTNGFAVVTTTDAEGAFVAYASVVDNASGDPVYIPAVEVGD